ncbi:glycosyltransferase family 2 protein [bacterium]|nr:glycosyltransferase family 2 protein [bacterium]
MSVKTSKHPRVYALMSVKDAKHVTLECIKALKGQTYPNIQIVLVDDGSTDGLEEELKEKHSEVQIIKGNGNLWFGGAMRLGLSEILKVAKKQEFVLFLNNDTHFDLNFVTTLVSESEQYGRITIGSTGRSFKTKQVLYNTHQFKLGMMVPRKVEVNEGEVNFNTQCLQTRGTLVPIEVVWKVGNFSKLFPHYSADYDYFFRVVKAGFKVGVSTKASTYVLDDDFKFVAKTLAKPAISLREYFKLFFHRRSYMNLYSRPLAVILHTVPFYMKVFALIRIYVYTIYIFFKKVRSI